MVRGIYLIMGLLLASGAGATEHPDEKAEAMERPYAITEEREPCDGFDPPGRTRGTSPPLPLLY